MAHFCFGVRWGPRFIMLDRAANNRGADITYCVILRQSEGAWGGGGWAHPTSWQSSLEKHPITSYNTYLTYSRPKGRAKKKFWLVKHEKNQSWDCPIHCSSEKQQSLFLMLMSIRHSADISDVNTPFCCGLQFCIKSWKYSIKQIVRYVFALDLHAHILSMLSESFRAKERRY